MDAATLASSRALLRTGLVSCVHVPNHDAHEVARMPRRPAGVNVRHCSLTQMLEDGFPGKLQLAFLDYCGAWGPDKVKDVQLLLPKLGKRALVALTICRRCKEPADTGLSMEDIMRADVERLASASGYRHVCIRTFRYAAAMLTVVYELVKSAS